MYISRAMQRAVILSFILSCCIFSPPPARAETASPGTADPAFPSGVPQPAAPSPHRRYDTLTEAELAELNRLEMLYLNGVRNEATGLVTAFFDAHTVIQTFTPQARIIRQRKRNQLNAVLRYLSSLRLEQEFITYYLNRLHDDATDYALDGMLQKARSLHR